MNNDNKAEFAQYWNATLQAKGQKPLTGVAIAMCFDDLIGYDINTIKSALKTFRRNPDEGQYHLQVSAIIKIIEGDSKSAANKAWMNVRRIATSVGGGDDIVLNDLIAMKCIQEMGGLQRLTEHACEFDLKDYSREFKVMYENYRIRGFENGPKMLEGSNNAERKRFGLPEIAPRKIGFDSFSDDCEKLPDMSKSRYKQIENASQVSTTEARENLKRFLFNARN